MSKQRYGAGIWHFATYVDRYATDGYGPPRPRPSAGTAELLTPPSSVAALRAGYRPPIDAGAGSSPRTSRSATSAT